MVRQRGIVLRAPLAGENRRASFQSQPPYSTPGSLNVRPIDVLEDRARLGRRGGYTRYGSAYLANPIRMLANLRYLANDDRAFEIREDDFSGGSMGDVWQAESWIAGGLPTNLGDGLITAELADGEVGGAIKPADELQIHPYAKDGTSGVTAVYSLSILPHKGRLCGTYKMFAGLRYTGDPAIHYNPRAASSSATGISAEVTLDSDTLAAQGSVYYRYGLQTVDSEGSSHSWAYPVPALLQLVLSWNYNGAFSADYLEWELLLNGSVLVSGDSSGLPAANRVLFRYGVGFSVQCTESGEKSLVNHYDARYYKRPDGYDPGVAVISADSVANQPPKVRNVLAASVNGDLYVENMRGALALAVSENMQPDKSFQAVDYEQKLYIGNTFDPVLAFPTLTYVGTHGTYGQCLQTPLLNAAQQALVSTGDFFIVRFAREGAPANGVEGCYRITAINHTTYSNFTVDHAGTWSTADTQLASAYLAAGEIRNGAPMVYNPADESLTEWTSLVVVGSLPLAGKHIAKFSDRIVLAEGTGWYMCRQGNPYDWDYSAEDVGAAVAGPLSEAGRMGDSITALIPGTEDYLIFGCHETMWIMRGDPAFGGRLSSLAQTGVVGAQAWCRTPDQWLIFLSRDGLYALSPSASAYPEPISHDRLPRELKDIDPHQHEIFMAYNSRGRGIHIYVTPLGRSPRDHWWFDWTAKGFFRESLPVNYTPTAVLNRSSDLSIHRGLWVGQDSGWMRYEHPAAAKDDDTAIDDYALIGPFRLGNEFFDGQMLELSAALATDSGDVTWSLYVRKTAEEAVAAAQASETTRFTGNWTAGSAKRNQPRARGYAGVLRIESKSGAVAPWVIERITAKLKLGGLVKMV